MGMINPNMGSNLLTSKTRTPTCAGLANALFTKVQQRVLAVLFGRPGRSFYANEIIAIAGSGTGAVQRELAKLVDVGLVTVRRQGNQKHYQADASSPIFGELRGLVIKTSGLADVVRIALSPLAPQICAAFVYGSIEKSQDASASDIDLMAVSDTLTYAEFFAGLEQASADLGRVINPTVYTNKVFERKMREGKAFLTRVVSQPKLWVIGDEHGLAA